MCKQRNPDAVVQNNELVILLNLWMFLKDVYSELEEPEVFTCYPISGFSIYELVFENQESQTRVLTADETLPKNTETIEYRVWVRN